MRDWNDLTTGERLFLSLVAQTNLATGLNGRGCDEDNYHLERLEAEKEKSPSVSPIPKNSFEVGEQMALNLANFEVGDEVRIEFPKEVNFFDDARLYDGKIARIIAQTNFGYICEIDGERTSPLHPNDLHKLEVAHHG